MKTRMPALFVACAVSACASQPVPDKSQPVPDKPLPDENAPEVRVVSFTCTNGQSLAVRFFPAHGVAVLVRNGQTTELQQQPSGSGFIYGNGPITIRGKGKDLTVEIGRMVPLECKAE
ncbi:MAG: hypothetical protein BGP10_07930 [Rhodanobacter sp. 68-29]|nr:MliC family protein [Rhodanobacter sp.]ODU75653.1 MAG: hypothetical protein ABT17_02765 [Rhodanobacter sp. SCN 69-32]OJY56940.1 MAG: hypothetical protein BGP10_07930 [Rhodanobacter sp. 68-29]